MAFASYEELKSAVEVRRNDLLTLEIDLGGKYSQEHEDAKRALATAKGLQTLAGGQGFLADNLAELEATVEATKPTSGTVWAQYRRIPLDEWGLLMKSAQATSSLEQYEKVLPKVFVGLYGADPVKPEDWDKVHAEDFLEWDAPEVFTTSGAVVSSKGNEGILSGALLHSVVQQFMNWQNSGGDVTIRPTKSGLV